MYTLSSKQHNKRERSHNRNPNMLGSVTGGMLECLQAISQSHPCPLQHCGCVCRPLVAPVLSARSSAGIPQHLPPHTHALRAGCFPPGSQVHLHVAACWLGLHVIQLHSHTHARMHTCTHLLWTEARSRGRESAARQDRDHQAPEHSKHHIHRQHRCSSACPQQHRLR